MFTSKAPKLTHRPTFRNNYAYIPCAIFYRVIYRMSSVVYGRLIETHLWMGALLGQDVLLDYYHYYYMSPHMWKWHLSHRQPAKAWARLRWYQRSLARAFAVWTHRVWKEMIAPAKQLYVWIHLCDKFSFLVGCLFTVVYVSLEIYKYYYRCRKFFLIFFFIKKRGLTFWGHS